MGTFIIIYLIYIHWIADFIFQDEKWALNKSTSVIALLKHTITYSLVLGVLILPFLYWQTIPFVIINFIMHTLIDYFSSKVVSKRFRLHYLGGPIPNFGAFTVIGSDQVLHYICLFLSFEYLI
jgi:hypothetical protein